MSSRTLFFNRCKYELKENTIIEYTDQLVCYHKREYDWVENRKFVFEDDKAPIHIFNILEDAIRTTEINTEKRVKSQCSLELQRLSKEWA